MMCLYFLLCSGVDVILLVPAQLKRVQRQQVVQPPPPPLARLPLRLLAPHPQRYSRGAYLRNCSCTRNVDFSQLD